MLNRLMGAKPFTEFLLDALDNRQQYPQFINEKKSICVTTRGRRLWFTCGKLVDSRFGYNPAVCNREQLSDAAIAGITAAVVGVTRTCFFVRD